MRPLALAAPLLLAMAALASAQTAPDWRRIGSTGVELRLASPATGPVERVWFGPGGAPLYARTRLGRVFATADFDTWTIPAKPPEAANPVAAVAARLPETGARVVAGPSGSGRLFALGLHLWRSDDDGHTWENLTAYRTDSVVGAGQSSLAISSADSDQLVLANDYGVWRSLDGGLSWMGLNTGLPNLPVRRILATPGAAGGARIEVDGLGALELPPGGPVWLPATPAETEREAAARAQYSAVLNAPVTAWGATAAGDAVYAGTEDGRLWTSVDGGRSFRQSFQAPGARVERLVVVDPAQPRIALAVLSGEGPRLLRTTTTGAMWDAIDAGLPDGPVRAVAADRASGAVYAATSKGVFLAYTDLENSSFPSLTWTRLDRLPEAPATDVRLDPAGFQLYVAMEGYGLYAAAAPHRLRNLRVVNAADFSARAAAPGSLITVIGSAVKSASGGNLEYPVLAVLDAESQIQVPFEAVGPRVGLSFQTAEGVVRRDVAVQPVSPAIFVGRDGGPWLYDGDSGKLVDLNNPARPNGRVQIMATGLGRVSPGWPTGMAAPLENTPAVAAEVRAFLNGSPVAVTRATLAPGYVGFYIVEVQLPAAMNAGAADLYLTAGGQESNRVRIAIEP
jgi:uncharacterized protein (TIGR03437 family)